MASEEPATATELQAEIAETRRELGETMASLLKRTNPKIVARAKVDQVKARVRQRSAPALALVVAATVALVAARLYSRRRSR